MHITKKYNEMEDIEEINVSDLDKTKAFKPSSKILEVNPPAHVNILQNIPSDVNIFLPIYDGDDYIIVRLGWNILEKLDITLDDVVGRKFSEVMPVHFNIVKDLSKKALTSSCIEKLRIYYYNDNKLSSIVHSIILEEHNKLYIIDEYINKNPYTRQTLYPKESVWGMGDGYGRLPISANHKTDLLEYISQSGNYVKDRYQYMWSPGVYNILNRFPEKNDEYYNIIFDLVVDEDQKKVQNMIKSLTPQNPHVSDIIKIKTGDGDIKHINIQLRGKFDERGTLNNTNGFFKDVSYNKTNTSSMDYIMNKFIKDTKMALIMNPFSEKYSFSDGFYNILEIEKKEYTDGQWIVDNIKEKDVVERIKKAFINPPDVLNEKFTYRINEQKEKVLELSVEKVKMDDNETYVGYLIDISSDIEEQRQKQLVEKQNTVIKEVHHRIKNNLQILNSFINLEKKVYADDPELVIDHMQSRINSLAVLHSQTYESMDYESLNLNESISEQDESLRHLLDPHGSIESIKDIPQDLYLPISTVTPILLLINELTTNAVKHAFKNRKDKKIFKTVKILDDDNCEFTFKDNGVGLKDNGNNSNSLGFTIIKSLTSQINGKLEINVDNGTEFKITFPITQEYVGYNCA